MATPKRVGRWANDTPEQAKERFLGALSQGMNINQALEVARRTRNTYEVWRRNDPQFVADCERIKSNRSLDRMTPGTPMEYVDFSEEFLDAFVFPHTQNMIDLIEGRDPSWLHPAMTYQKGERDLVMVNMPPEHAKTTSVTINYITYRIAMDPNIRVIIVSKTQPMAMKMLYAIKTRLTHPKYARFHIKYAPEGGFDSNSEAWNQTMIYVSDSARDSGEKDPTVQALGIRGHIYGSRADLIVLDDCVDLTNAHEYEKQIDWIQSEVMSRISASGSLLVVGTRLASKDLYSELRNPERYSDGDSPWTYLAMPAVLDFGNDDPKTWTTLWPRSNQPEAGDRGAEPDSDGLYPKWDGPRLAKKRRRVGPLAWSKLYMQQQVSDNATFDPDAVRAAINGNRLTGLIPKGQNGNRPEGMDGLVIVAGLDPATTGCTAAVVVGMDVRSQKRYVLDVYNKAGTTPEEMRDLIKDWTDKYRIAEWRIERNGFQGFLVHDTELNNYCAARGTIIRPHFTGTNKHDPSFGVAAMSMLFAGWKDKAQLIELPSTAVKEAAKQMVEQLVTWSPDLPKGHKTDIVMALWFAELACQDRVMSMSNYRTHVSNPFLTPWDRRNQTTVNLLDLEVQGAFTPIGY